MPSVRPSCVVTEKTPPRSTMQRWSSMQTAAPTVRAISDTHPASDQKATSAAARVAPRTS